MQVSIFLLSIVCLIQAITIHFIQKDVDAYKKHIIAFYAIFHKKFGIKTTEIAENLENYAEKDINFIDN